MRFRLHTFGLHLAGSASALALVLGAFWLGWYRWPGWYLASVLHIVGIVVMVDLVLGPTLTLIVANPGKRRAVLARDIAIIVAVQLIALVYGGVTLCLGRPLYYTFSVDRLELVQASDLKTDDVGVARRENPALAPWWYSRPRWIWAPLPANPQEAEKIAMGAVLGGADVIQMPRYFRPWEQGLPELRKRLLRVDDTRYFSAAEKRTLKSRITQLGLAADQANTMVMWGGTRRVLAVFDPETVEIRALIKAD
ncbi:MAG TPA: hypothetical protein VEC59_02225 [Steroidobacteraceae bacterium]|nr:hypothetical protein [Steroidobacteraceae bacterium]